MLSSGSSKVWDSWSKKITHKLSSASNLREPEVLWCAAKLSSLLRMLSKSNKQSNLRWCTGHITISRMKLKERNAIDYGISANNESLPVVFSTKQVWPLKGLTFINLQPVVSLQHETTRKRLKSLRSLSSGVRSASAWCESGKTATVKLLLSLRKVNS